MVALRWASSLRRRICCEATLGSFCGHPASRSAPWLAIPEFHYGIVHFCSTPYTERRKVLLFGDAKALEQFDLAFQFALGVCRAPTCYYSHVPGQLCYVRAVLRMG